MATQSQNGKAFEYAMITTLKEHLEFEAEVRIVENQEFEYARSYFHNKVTEEYADGLVQGSIKPISTLLAMEPRLANLSDGETLVLSMQTDSVGQKGDVRDIVCRIPGIDWEIGLSCKTNHEAVKHPRLSKTLNFGESWFDLSNSTHYFEEISPVFEDLYELRKQGRIWKDLPHKNETIYLPILRAFSRELERLESAHGPLVPQRLVEYMLGRHDFYKIMIHHKDRRTSMHAYNLNGTLNRSAGVYQPRARASVLPMPSVIYRIRETSKTTLRVDLDEGWSFSMRIHNASSKVEPSLKFDINLQGTPASLYQQTLFWN